MNNNKKTVNDNKVVVKRSTLMRDVFRNRNNNITYSTSLVHISSSRQWYPATYSIDKIWFSHVNTGNGLRKYHPFCFNITIPDRINNIPYYIKTSHFPVFFEEDKNVFPNERFTGYSIDEFSNMIVPIMYLDLVFSSNYISAQSWYKYQKVKVGVYLFRFFDSTYCGCSNMEENDDDFLCPEGPTTSSGGYAKPGAIILVDRSSEINTVSMPDKYPTYVTRSLSNAILDYCEKNNKTPRDIMPNLIWDEELSKF